jgi:predicted acyltransferase
VSSKIVMLAVVLVGYWILMRWVPVPGAGVPGRDIPFLDKDVNMVNWLDQRLMPGHLYEDGITHSLRDPEGLLSDLPALGTALLGLLTGIWLRGRKTLETKGLGLAAGSAACLALGFFWSIWFPLNKKMWTSSYVLVAAGYSLALFALIFWVVELKGWNRKGAGKGLAWPWLVFGSNAIVAYMVSELLGSAVEFIRFHSGGRVWTPFWYWNHWLAAHIADPGWAAFAYSFSYMAICFVPVWVLYRKKIFLKV